MLANSTILEEGKVTVKVRLVFRIGLGVSLEIILLEMGQFSKNKQTISKSETT